MLTRPVSMLALISILGLPRPAAPAGPFPRTCDQVDARGCRTVVVFGDTQDIADYESGLPGEFPRVPWLAAMVDWVIENRAAENIDFVLHVGDITEHGWWLPMALGCLGSCGAPNCHCPAEVAGEWRVFNEQFQRLEAAGVPYAIVPGNHENIRSAGGPLDGPGFSDYYSPARLAALPGYLESRGSTASGCIASAWEFALGPQPVIVLGLPDSSVNPPGDSPPDGTGAVDRCPADDPEIDDWANQLIERPEHREKQVILLHHRLLELDLARRPKWMNTIARRPERFVAGVSGHWSPSVFPFMSESHSKTGAPLRIFAPRVDWQDAPLPGMSVPTAASSFAVMRFHLRAGRPDQLEVRVWSEFFQVADGVVEDVDGDGEPDTADDGVPLQDYSILHDRDLDGDAVPDDVDLCPYFPNPSGLDTDGDGRGDECECTDQNGDGTSSVSDLIAISEAIFNPALVTPLCDGNNDGACDVNDLLAANMEIFSPGNSSSCARQPVAWP